MEKYQPSHNLGLVAIMWHIFEVLKKIACYVIDCAWLKVCIIYIILIFTKIIIFHNMSIMIIDREKC